MTSIVYNGNSCLFNENPYGVSSSKTINSILLSLQNQILFYFANDWWLLFLTENLMMRIDEKPSMKEKKE